MSKLFIISEEEKNRILNLHESATNRQYLPEQNNVYQDPLNLRQFDTIVQGAQGDPYQYMRFADNFFYAKKSDGKNPKWAKVNDLDAIESIRTSVFNMLPKPKQVKKVDNKKVDSSKTNVKPKKEKISKITKYNFSPRIDQELKYIVDRNLDNKPFFIYDPKDNLLYFFDKSLMSSPPKLIDYTSVVDGADTQKDSKTFTVSDWCKVSKNKNKKFLLDKPYNCTDPDTGEKTLPGYSVLTSLKSRFLPKGIYSIGYLSQNKGYAGTGKNQFGLKDSKGIQSAAAIHGIPNIEERLTASKDLEDLLKKNIENGIVPQEYLNSIKTIASANQSFGCIGVPAKFIDNPKVKKLAPNSRVFVMGETKQNFLVQNSSEFFDKLSGDGKQCFDPTRLAQSMSDNNSAVA
jgi:hypothetical protein